MKWVLIIVFLELMSCKTITKSLVLGTSVGALTGGGLGGAVHYKDRKKGAIVTGIIGAGAGALTSYYLYKQNKTNHALEIESFEKSRKKICEAKINEALLYANGEVTKPEIVPKYIPGQVKGGRFIGGRVDWVMNQEDLVSTAETQNIIEEKKKLEVSNE